MRLLPPISTFLGHVNMEATQAYLSMTPKLLQQVSSNMGGEVAASDAHTLGLWLRFILHECLVTDRSLARNTQKSYPDTFVILPSCVSNRGPLHGE